MRKRIWVTSFALATVLTSVLAPSASAGPRSLKPPTASSESIDDLRATDAQLVKAVEDLAKQVAEQEAAVQSAEQAIQAAEQAAAANEKGLADTQADIDRLAVIATERAVTEYMHPNDDLVGQMLLSEGVGEDSTRRSEFMRQLSSENDQIVDELKAAKKELKKEQAAALEAKKVADARKKAAEAKLEELHKARAEKEKFEESLKKRIADYAAEDEAATRIKVETPSAPDRASRSDNNVPVINDDGRTSSAGVIWPLTQHQVNSPFGYRWGRQHAGIDLEAKIGTPIFSIQSGKVIQAGWESGYGQYTCIDHGAGFSSCYAHQSRIGVSVGQTVERGQNIGVSGNSGASQGAHLHFETRVNGSPRNPMNYLP